MKEKLIKKISSHQVLYNEVILEFGPGETKVYSNSIGLDVVQKESVDVLQQ